MSDVEDDTEISFSVKFLDRVEVVRPDGMQILMEAASSLQDPDRELSEKVRKKKTKVHLFLSRSAIDILEHKTKTQPKLFGFIARHPAVDSYHCYLFQSKKFSPLLVSVIGDAFRANQQSTSLRGSRDLVVEALRHKNNVLQRENSELRRKLQGSHGNGTNVYEDMGDSDTEQPNSQVRFSSPGDFQRNT